MRSLKRRLVSRLVLPSLLLCGTIAAQQSASFKNEEHSFNAGGRPADGVVATSGSFKVSLDAIGDSVALSLVSGDSFGVDGGFVPAYVPPGEVENLHFTDSQTLVWDAEKSVGVYNLYRDVVSNITGLTYGACHEQDVVSETTVDADLPPASDAFFYLVTAENLLTEEGTKGIDSAATERANPAPCP